MKQTRPNFEVSQRDFRLITAIVDRAMKFGANYSRMDCDMDLCAAHNSCPMDLERLLASDDFNFAHDIFGIRNHIDRNTGELGNCFVPRYALPN